MRTFIAWAWANASATSRDLPMPASPSMIDDAAVAALQLLELIGQDHSFSRTTHHLGLGFGVPVWAGKAGMALGR